MDGWKTQTKFIKQFTEIYSCLESRARYMDCLVSWYIPGTFGHAGFVSFGDCTLNSCNQGRVMCWSARACHGQIKYTAGPSWTPNPCICVNDVTVSMKLFLLKVEIWVEKQLWTLASTIRRTGIKEEFCYLKWPRSDDREVATSSLNSSCFRTGLSAKACNSVCHRY